MPAIKVNSGADIYTERLANALNSRGIETEITWFPPYFEFFPELMRLHAVPDSVDVIHANSWNAVVFIGRDRPVVATVHHLVHDPKFRPYRSTLQAAYHQINVYHREKKAIEECNAVISVSKYTASVVKNIFGNNSIVIPNWVDTNKFCPASVQWSNAKFTILIVGNRGLRKGSDLIPALSHSLGAGFEIRVTGGLRDTKRQAKSTENVFMLGHLDEEQLIEEYQRCDAVVSLSRYEGFGYTALEAMSCAKPFLGFDTSAISEVISHGKTGFLAKIDDVSELTGYIKFLSKDSKFREEFGIEGRKRALQVFPENAAIDSYIAMYERLINARN